METTLKKDCVYFLREVLTESIQAGSPHARPFVFLGKNNGQRYHGRRKEVSQSPEQLPVGHSGYSAMGAMFLGPRATRVVGKRGEEEAGGVEGAGGAHWPSP